MINGRFADPLSQTDDLEKLEINLDQWTPMFAFLLIGLVADHVWLGLTKVALSGIGTTEDERMRG